MNKGQTTGRLLLSALLAFNLFGFVGIGYADPAAPSEGFVDDAVEVVDPEVPAASEVPEGSDLAEPEAPVDAQGFDALAEADPVDEPESDAINAKEPEDSAEAQAAAPGVRVASAEEAAPTETTSYAQPGSGDFDFDSRTGTINKLKASYVAGLTDEQKQDVRLVIPAEINGVAVTALGDSAFYSYTNRGLTFTEFDLSQTTSL